MEFTRISIYYVVEGWWQTRLFSAVSMAMGAANGGSVATKENSTI
jgi:hypothetical protein